jgi:hypothetical protein
MPNDLRWLNDHAGKRATPYPHETATAGPPTCPGCGAAVTGERGHDGLPRTYCSEPCRKTHHSRLQFALSEAARHERRLGLKVYGD